MDLGICDPRVIVKDGVDERLTHQRPAVLAAHHRGGDDTILLSLLPSDEAMPAAIGDIAELGDVDVNHGARVWVLVAADDFAGAFIDVMQFIYPASHQHRMDCRGWHAQLGADTDRSQAMFPPQVSDLAHERLRCPIRTGMRPRRAVLDSSCSHCRIAGGPPARCWPRDVEVFRGRRYGPAVVDNQARDP